MENGIELRRFTLGPFAENCYLLVGPSGRKAALVDPGIGSEPLLKEIEAHGLDLEWIVNTHGHLDHVAGNAFFKTSTDARLIIHPDDAPMLSQMSVQARFFGLEAESSPPPDAHFVEGEPFRFDGAAIEVIHTPGHSPGGVCLRFGERMLVGDTLFRGSIGRTDLPGGSADQLIASIRLKLFRLPAETVCYPGHGPETTLVEERTNNPFVSDRVADATAADDAWPVDG